MLGASRLQPRKWQPTMTRAILVLNVLVWVADSIGGLVLGVAGAGLGPGLLLAWGAKSNGLIVQGEIWRLVTPIFLHVGLLHLAFNAYAIYIIGPQIECFFGPLRFISIYLLSGIYGVLFSFAFSRAPSAGASGAIFGLIGTQAAFFFQYRNAFGERGRRQLYSTLSVIAFNMVLTFTASGIDIWGHVGGLVVGTILGWSLTPRYALAQTKEGTRLTDLNHPGRWGVTVAGAVVVLVISTWLTIAVQAARL
jgi:rhomboid protease GluP